MRSLLDKLSFSNVMSVTAVFLALAGSALAVGIAKNSVGSKQIKRGGVRLSDLAANSVNSEKVVNGSLLGEDFAPGQLPKGDPGEDATKLFAYITDVGGTGNENASVAYGQGVTNVSDPNGANHYISPYVVTFNQSLVNCVAQATQGSGDPVASGSGLIGPMAAYIQGNTVRVFSFENGGPAQDTAFMLSVFC